MSKGHVLVHLSDEMWSDANRRGLIRYEKSRKDNLNPAIHAGPRTKAEQLQHELVGYMSVIAVAVMLNEEWRTVEPLDTFTRVLDIPDVCEVRGATTTNRRCRIYDTEHDDRACMFAPVVPGRKTVMILGSINIGDGKRKGRWEDPTGTGFAYWVERKDLDELSKDYLRHNCLRPQDGHRPGDVCYELG